MYTPLRGPSPLLSGEFAVRALPILMPPNPNAHIFQPHKFYPHLPTTAMPEIIDETEDRIQEALHAYHDRDKPKMTELAREFEVSYRWTSLL